MNAADGSSFSVLGFDQEHFRQLEADLWNAADSFPRKFQIDPQYVRRRALFLVRDFAWAWLKGAMLSAYERLEANRVRSFAVAI